MPFRHDSTTDEEKQSNFVNVLRLFSILAHQFYFGFKHPDNGDKCSYFPPQQTSNKAGEDDDIFPQFKLP